MRNSSNNLQPSETLVEGRFSRPSIPSRINQERRVRKVFFVITLIPIILLIGIIIALIIRTWPILEKYPLKDLVMGTVWKPQKGLFGFYPFISGTFWSHCRAHYRCSSLHLHRYLPLGIPGRQRNHCQAPAGSLAAIPSFVYGVWGLVAIVLLIGNHISPFFKNYLDSSHFSQVKTPPDIASWLAALFAVLFAPFIISIIFECCPRCQRVFVKQTWPWEPLAGRRFARLFSLRSFPELAQGSSLVQRARLVRLWRC